MRRRFPRALRSTCIGRGVGGGMPGSSSVAESGAAPRAALLALVPVVFFVAALAYPCRQYHWDTLERAYLLEHPARYLTSWDGTPRSQFLSFAHVLELP